jgi:hypothetical protein
MECPGNLVRRYGASYPSQVILQALDLRHGFISGGLQFTRYVRADPLGHRLGDDEPAQNAVEPRNKVLLTVVRGPAAAVVGASVVDVPPLDQHRGQRMPTVGAAEQASEGERLLLRLPEPPSAIAHSPLHLVEQLASHERLLTAGVDFAAPAHLARMARWLLLHHLTGRGPLSREAEYSFCHLSNARWAMS